MGTPEPWTGKDFELMFIGEGREKMGRSKRKKVKAVIPAAD